MRHGEIFLDQNVYQIARDYTYNGITHQNHHYGEIPLENIPMERVVLVECDAFEVKDCAYLTDPCYKLGTWCSEPLYNKCMPGQWTGRVFGDLDFLVAHHVDHPVSSIDMFRRAKKPLCDLGVDSGMIGMLNKTLTTNEYYCMIEHFDTYDKPLILNIGIISNTKMGDGSYSYRYLTNNKKQIVAIAIDMR
jgi:hypothetical protein